MRSVADTIGDEGTDESGKTVGDFPRDGPVGLLSTSPPDLTHEQVGGLDGRFKHPE